MAGEPCPSRFMPKIDQLGITNNILYEGDALSAVSIYGNEQERILYKDIPFARYWQLKDKRAFVFHPMVAGRTVGNFAQSKDARSRSVVNALWNVGIELQNGGRAWYYPEHYPLNRMVGPDITYSAISQAEILAGLGKAEDAGQAEHAQVVGAFRGLVFDWCSGGTNLAGKALLEMPLFRSAPEIILNGWLHALLSVMDYYEATKDLEAKGILDSNLAFLSSVVDRFDDREHRLARYSDLSPYAIRLLGQNLGPISVTYDGRKLGLGLYKWELESDQSTSPFDNRVISRANGETRVMASCSGTFSTTLHAQRPFVARLSAGLYDPTHALPGTGGEVIDLKADEHDGDFTVSLDAIKARLICGYPTNFSKVGAKNYYHVQHVVALSYLALSYPMPVDQKAALLKYAALWREDMEHHPGMTFAHIQDVLDGLNRSKRHRQVKSADDIEQLLRPLR